MHHATRALFAMFQIHLAALFLTVAMKLITVRYYIPGLSEIYAIA